MTNPAPSKIVLLTGSTSGIGKATAQEIVKSTTTLILPVRNLAKGEDLKKELLVTNPGCLIDLLICDFDSIVSVKNLIAQVNAKYSTIDILINNAGILNDSKVITRDNLEQTFQVNVLSQFFLNSKLLPLVKNSEQGRIINLSSNGHYQGQFDMDNLQGEKENNKVTAGVKLYFNSNLYRNLLTLHLAKMLAGTSVTVNCLHPGAIATSLGAHNNSIFVKILVRMWSVLSRKPDYGAKTILFLALDPSVATISGKYWDNCQQKTPSQLSLDTNLADQLWKKCEEIVDKVN